MRLRARWVRVFARYPDGTSRVPLISIPYIGLTRGERLAAEMPSFDEVVELVQRGRPYGPTCTTGSPVIFGTSDGVECCITFTPAVPPARAIHGQ